MGAGSPLLAREGFSLFWFRHIKGKRSTAKLVENVSAGVLEQPTLPILSPIFWETPRPQQIKPSGPESNRLVRPIKIQRPLVFSTGKMPGFMAGWCSKKSKTRLNPTPSSLLTEVSASPTRKHRPISCVENLVNYRPAPNLDLEKVETFALDVPGRSPRCATREQLPYLPPRVTPNEKPSLSKPR